MFKTLSLQPRIFQPKDGRHSANTTRGRILPRTYNHFTQVLKKHQQNNRHTIIITTIFKVLIPLSNSSKGHLRQNPHGNRFCKAKASWIGRTFLPGNNHSMRTEICPPCEKLWGVLKWWGYRSQERPLTLPVFESPFPGLNGVLWELVQIPDRRALELQCFIFVCNQKNLSIKQGGSASFRNIQLHVKLLLLDEANGISQRLAHLVVEIQIWDFLCR